MFSIMAMALCVLACNRKENAAHGVNLMEEGELIAFYDRENYDEVYIVNHDGEEVAHYVLTDRYDTTRYEIPEDAIEIKVPLERIVVDSEVYASAFEELQALDKLMGMFDTQFVTSPAIRKRIDKGQITELGQPSSPNIEKLISLHPDAILVSYFDGMQTQNIDKAGYPIFRMYDLQEATPLGRAEWLRVLGRLVGKEEVADSIFYSVADSYRNEKAKATQTIKNQPKVLTEKMYEGVWYVPGGKSYQARMLKDAGGNYFKSEDDKTVSLNLTAEQVLIEGGDADIWFIRYYGDKEHLMEELNADPVYKEIKAYSDSTIYYSDTSKSRLFLEFPFHPDLLLRDYRIIFSGDTLETPRYFHRLH